MEQEKITLTLDNNTEEIVEEEKQETTQEEFDFIAEYDVKLSDEEKQMVEEFSKQIDITKSEVILQYGSQAQNKISTFSDTALANVRTKDLGSVGDSLSHLVSEIKKFNSDEKQEGGIFDFLKKQTNGIENVKARYDKVDVNVSKIVKVLEEHQIALLKDIALLDELYEKNLNNFKELSMYILAGYKKLEDIKENELAKLIEISEKTGKAEDAQAANDLANSCERFEKKLHDLELTRAISIQMAPQIRLLQNNDTLMTEKIQSTIVNTIPLWKSQMVLALGVNHSKQAMQAQREVSNMTNALLKKNAEILKTSTIEVARESERGIVDLETLKETNQKLITTLDDVIKIQDEGRTRRREAQKELARIEEELNKKLLEIKK